MARRGLRALPVVAVVGAAVAGMPAANADNKRLNDGVVANVYTIQHQAGCTNDVKINPKLQLAAEWHADDVPNNRALDGDIGSDGSTPQSRANAAGYTGTTAETVATNPALAISGLAPIFRAALRCLVEAVLAGLWGCLSQAGMASRPVSLRWAGFPRAGGSFVSSGHRGRGVR
jgi:hypothetical protein